MDMTYLRSNGINATSGDYLLPPITVSDFAKTVRGERMDPGQMKEMQWHLHRMQENWLGPKEGVDPKMLSQAGWGVIFAHEEGQHSLAVQAALQPLLELRRRQAGLRYREFTGQNALLPKETKNDFLARQGIGPGPADPDKVPYYLLIVGDPQRIPYRFQYQLDVEYAVGRIYFDSLDDYANYANRVVAAETGDLYSERRIGFFAPSSDGDTTEILVRDLVKPLVHKISVEQPDWTVTSITDGEATKARLVRCFDSVDAPTVLFTASHGLGFDYGDSRQLRHQGGLLCADWPGCDHWKQAIPERFYYSADDVVPNAKLHGMISFHFACYGAGTLMNDELAQRILKRPSSIAPHAFVAALPQRLLSGANGGTLAVVGHIERVWSFSFLWQNSGVQLEVFNSMLKRLMAGFPIGWAMEFFGSRYAELSTMLNSELEDIQFGKIPNDVLLADLWTANHDARNYVIVGDPAVRLPLVEQNYQRAG